MHLSRCVHTIIFQSRFIYLSGYIALRLVSSSSGRYIAQIAPEREIVNYAVVVVERALN